MEQQSANPNETAWRGYIVGFDPAAADWDQSVHYPVMIGQPARLVRVNDSVMGWLVGGAALAIRRVIRWIRR